MENNEIMVNEEIMGATEEIVPAIPKKGLIIAGVTAAALVVGGFVYKKFIKPAIAKAKADKESGDIEGADYEVYEDSES